MPTPMFTVETENKNFNKHIKQFLKETNISTEKVLKKFAFDLLARIMKKTPVDMGRARGGWIYSAEKLSAGIGSGAGIVVTTSSPNYSKVAENLGKSEGGYSENFRGPDKWIEIVNGVSYIIFLEFGHSKQSAFGMVRVSMREMRHGKLPEDMSKAYKKDWNKFYMTG